MGRKTFFLAFFALWAASAAAGEATIQSCSDGDTCAVQVAGFAFKVRLIGVDAPEMGRRKGEGQPFAREAKDALNRMVAGKRLEIAQHGLDGYNRPLVTIRLEDGDMANERLVAAGLAEVYEGPSKYDTSRLRYLQDRAKSEGRGMWSLGSKYVSPYLYRKRARLSAEE
ncbi:MAG TPA: thermonuclease family protein [bacterium]|nr:thermonuclease family protein [bacterium]